MRPFLSFSRTFTLITGASREKVLAILKGQTASPLSLSREEWSGRAFVGKVDDGGFTISDFVNYRSSFLPAVQGHFLSRGKVTDLRVRMRPHREVIIFFSIWMTFLFLCTLVLLLASQKTSRFFFLPVPLGLAAFSWILGAKVFESDCRWALGEIAGILEEGGEE